MSAPPVFRKVPKCEAATRGWDYLIEASFHDGSFHLTFGPMALVVGAIVLFGWLAWWSWRNGRRFDDYEVGEATLKIFEIAEVKSLRTTRPSRPHIKRGLSCLRGSSGCPSIRIRMSSLKFMILGSRPSK